MRKCTIELDLTTVVNVHKYFFIVLNKEFSFLLGCIFDLKVRAGKDQEFKVPGIPEGHPNTGRNVGQCAMSPCQLIICRNGGTCMESGSAV